MCRLLCGWAESLRIRKEEAVKGGGAAVNELKSMNMNERR